MNIQTYDTYLTKSFVYVLIKNNKVEGKQKLLFHKSYLIYGY